MVTCTPSCTSRKMPSTPQRASTCSAKAVINSARSLVSRSPSKTCCAPSTCRQQPARGSSRAGFPPMTRPSCAGCARPTSCPSARRTWTSSPWARRRSTRPTAPRTTRGISTAYRVAPAAAPLRRLPRSKRPWHWEATPVARSANRPPSPAVSVSSRPTAVCRDTGRSRSRARSTRWAP
jgi:hypothetical protein